MATGTTVDSTKFTIRGETVAAERCCSPSSSSPSLSVPEMVGLGVVLPRGDETANGSD